MGIFSHYIIDVAIQADQPAILLPLLTLSHINCKKPRLKQKNQLHQLTGHNRLHYVILPDHAMPL